MSNDSEGVLLSAVHLKVMDELQNSKTKCPKKAFISRLSVDSDSPAHPLDGAGTNQFSAEHAQAQARAIVARHQRVESLSQMSLPDDLRISFSEIEDSSLQLDDIDLTCSSSVDVDLTSGNIAPLQEMKEEEHELQNINAAISSTSQPHYQRLTSMDRLSNVAGSRSGSVSQFGSEGSDDTVRESFGMIEDAVKSESTNMSDFMFTSDKEAWKNPTKAQQVLYIVFFSDLFSELYFTIKI